jgi:hypothetical protein
MGFAQTHPQVRFSGEMRIDFWMASCTRIFGTPNLIISSDMNQQSGLACQRWHSLNHHCQVNECFQSRRPTQAEPDLA